MTNNHMTTGRKRALIAAGSLIGVGALITAAAFTDFANLNLGDGTSDSGIGGNNQFNIQVVGTDVLGDPVPGTWQEANSLEGVDVNVPGASTLTPGDSTSIDIPFRNESPTLSAEISFTLQDRAGFTSDAGIAAALRYTVTIDGVDVVTNVAQTAVSALDLGLYAAGAQETLVLTISFPDQGTQAANNALQGEVSYVQAHFDGVSVQP